ncbi:hypothetical protein CALVIDRAFT_417017 [Calocera viscosa TUFC12733]|uniref:mRNA decay factor PAT1 domain-containing protein n=1 Tax=Calocera viscosa (strain TUFC12733) TaxID=1330018 RepID=A0A167PFK6_CALVF|nr:hypothetical protein CALVIDRAFT_417017 [Calocera viscosa TUFC12733]
MSSPSTSSRQPSSRHKNQPSLEALWKDNSVSSVLGGFIPPAQPGASLLGARNTPPQHTPTPPRPTNLPPARGSQPRVMTLQEIEAEMEAQSHGVSTAHSVPAFMANETHAPPPLPPMQSMPQIPHQQLPPIGDGQFPPQHGWGAPPLPIGDGQFPPQHGWGAPPPRSSLEGMLPPEMRPASGGRHAFTPEGLLPPEMRPAGGASPYHSLPENTFSLPSLRPDMDLPPEMRPAGGRMPMDMPPLPHDTRAALVQAPPPPREPYYPPGNQMFSLDEIERQMQAAQLGGQMPPQQPMQQGPSHGMPDMAPEPHRPPPHNAPFDDIHRQPRVHQPPQQESNLFKGDVGDLLDFPPLGAQPLAGRPLIREEMPDTRTPVEIIELSVEKRASLMRDAQEKIKATEKLEAKRRRKAEKLAHMARRNELMSQGDKDFITRIQVSQLVTEDPYADDFYAQVFGAIVRARIGEGAAGEAVIKFGDVGVGMGIGRGAGRREKAMKRMRQQVEKLVQHAKNREKEKSADRECFLVFLSLNVLHAYVPSTDTIMEDDEPAHAEISEATYPNAYGQLGTPFILTSSAPHTMGNGYEAALSGFSAMHGQMTQTHSQPSLAMTAQSTSARGGPPPFTSRDERDGRTPANRITSLQPSATFSLSV